MPKNSPLLERGVKKDRETPHELFDVLDETYGPFDCDAACLPEQYSAQTIWSRGGEIFISPPIFGPVSDRERTYYDGLKITWRGKVYLNPPYGPRERACPDRCTKRRCRIRGEHNAADVPGIEDWVAKAVSEVDQGNAARVVALLPSTTGNAWWQRYVFARVERGTTGYLASVREDGKRRFDLPMARLESVTFLKGRLTFVDAGDPAGFASAVVVWERR